MLSILLPIPRQIFDHGIEATINLMYYILLYTVEEVGTANYTM